MTSDPQDRPDDGAAQAALDGIGNGVPSYRLAVVMPLNLLAAVSWVIIAVTLGRMVFLVGVPFFLAGAFVGYLGWFRKGGTASGKGLGLLALSVALAVAGVAATVIMINVTN